MDMLTNNQEFLTLAFLYAEKSLAQQMAELNSHLTQCHQNLILQQQLQPIIHARYPNPITVNPFSCCGVEQTIYADNRPVVTIYDPLQSAVLDTCCSSVQNVACPKEEPKTPTVVIKKPVNLRKMVKIENCRKDSTEERRFNKFWTFIFNKMAIFLAVWRYRRKIAKRG